jgi:hypothetical protein
VSRENEGRKYDSGKRRLSLLPFKALETVTEVLEYGAAKYDDENWRKVPDAQRRYYDAALRHLHAHKYESSDAETGKSHLAHAACCLLFLLELDSVGGEK